MSKNLMTRSAFCTLVTALPLAAALQLSSSSNALAACVAGGSVGITYECSGVSSNSSPATNHGNDPGITGDAGNAVFSIAPGTVLTNSSTVLIDIDTALNNTANTDGYQRTRLYGVSGGDPGDYTIINTATGSISVVHNGTGRAWGIAANGDATSMTIINAGTISVTRGATLGALSATAITARAGALANVALDVSAGIFSEEEHEEQTIVNSGVITTSGLLSAAIYSRAEEVEIANTGIIRTTTPTTGFAIAAVSDSGETRSMSLENSGTITGSVLAVGGHAQRWFGLSTGMGGTIDSRLQINSQFGQLDSEITNEEGGIINKGAGNTVAIYYGNGSHTLENEGSIIGDIDVDQRMQSLTGRTCTVGSSGCFATATTTGTSVVGNPTAEEASPNSASTFTTGAAVGSVTTYRLDMWGAKEFSFENAGEFIGNITIATAPATTIGGIAVGDSKIELAPYVYGGGGATANAATGPGTIATFQGTIKIADGMVNGAGGTSSIARTTTLAPVIAGTVKDGEWYKVSNGLFGTALPDVEGSALVEWEVRKNVDGALVIGAEVADAADIEGVSQPGAAAVNALIDAGGEDEDLDELGAAVQSLETEAQVAKAAAQLAPETNFATQQAALSLNSAIGQRIDTRLASAGALGGGGFNGPSGLGMKPSAQGRSNLGRGVDEDGVYIDEPRSNALWGAAFGAGLNQDTKDLVDGYDARLYGALAGYDNWISSNSRVGVAFGYANTRIDGKGATSANQTTIDSFLVELYGAVKGPGWYLSGRTGYTWHDLETDRVLTVPFRDQANASHDGSQFNAAVEVGAPMHMSGSIITPVASLTYSNLEQSSYTETSDGGMALAVASQSNDSFVTGLGLKALLPIAGDTAIEGRAIWQHEFLDTNQTVTAAFAAGGGSFTASGPDTGRDTAVVGVGMIANIAASSSFQINYDANVRQDFVGHVGSARLVVGF